MNERKPIGNADATFGPPPWPREHGAWAMWVGPLACGIALGGARPGHALLALTLLLAYLALAALLEHQRHGTRREARQPPAAPWRGARRRLRRWAALYATGAAAGGATLALATPALGALALAALGVALVQLELVRRRLDRSLAGGLLGIASLALAAPAAYLVGQGHLDARAWSAWGWMAGCFAGSLLFVRSLLRARGRAGFALAGSGFHLALTALAALFGEPLIALALALATARTLLLWRQRLRPVVIGAVEATNALVFTVLVVLALR